MYIEEEWSVMKLINDGNLTTAFTFKGVHFLKCCVYNEHRMFAKKSRKRRTWGNSLWNLSPVNEDKTTFLNLNRYWKETNHNPSPIKQAFTFQEITCWCLYNDNGLIKTFSTYSNGTKIILYLWIPEHSIQSTTPQLVLAHDGSGRNKQCNSEN